jgi:outer membrane biosynthesis protein TonB
MQPTTAKKISYASIIAAIVIGMAACNGSDSTNKSSSDSVATATNDTANAAAMADSASKAAKAKKKKGKTSISMPVANNDKISKDNKGVYNRAEAMPEFPGGQDALANYINKNIDYSQTAIDNNTDGTIRITFVVDEHGKVIDPHVMGDKKLGSGLDEETLRVFNNMPLWKPGKVAGKKVKTRLEIPITFQLEDA